jgi:xanthosine utilization system XapX-like protein
LTKLLAMVPFVGILVGVVWFNQATPIILGLPLVLAWLVLCTVASSAVLAVIYLIDPANRSDRASRR